MHVKGEKLLHYLGQSRIWVDSMTNRVGEISLDAVVKNLIPDYAFDDSGRWVRGKCVYTLTLSRADLEALNAKVATEDAAQAKSAREEVWRLKREVQALQEKLAELQEPERNQSTTASS